MGDLTPRGLHVLKMFKDEWGHYPLRANFGSVKKLIRDGLLEEKALSVSRGNGFQITTSWRRTEAGRAALREREG